MLVAIGAVAAGAEQLNRVLAQGLRGVVLTPEGVLPSLRRLVIRPATPLRAVHRQEALERAVRGTLARGLVIPVGAGDRLGALPGFVAGGGSAILGSSRGA